MLMLWLASRAKAAWLGLGKHYCSAKKYQFLVAVITDGDGPASQRKWPVLIATKHLEISPGVLKDIHRCKPNCGRLFGSLVGYKNK